MNMAAGIGAALGVLAGGAGAPANAQASAQRPGILLIVTDDQGYGDIGLHGNPRIKTPNLDRLGRESVRLTRFYVSPVCAPTRASLMTGRYNYRTGVVDTWLGRAMMHADEVTIAEMLHRGGYRTGIFGKWHLGDTYPLRAMDQGFEESLTHSGGGIGQPADPEGNSYFDPLLYRRGRPVRARGYCTDIFAREAARFLTARDDRPFFAYVAMNAPHVPLDVHESYVAPYRESGLDETTARVYGMVTNIDENVGRLLDALDRSGRAANTVVVFMSDNGPQQRRYNAGLRAAKGTVYEGGIRVPCFVRWPARLRPGEVDRITAHIDLAPTFLQMAGVEPPPGLQLDGRSLLPLLDGQADGWPERTLFLQWHRGDAPEPFRDCAAVTQRLKLVNGHELYDLQADPSEERDVSGERPEAVLRLREAYLRWFRDVSATRGYDPPRIVLGAEAAPAVVLTRQDWRGPRAGWEDTALGHWEVAVERGGTYRVTLALQPGPTPCRAHLRIDGVVRERSVRAGARTCEFEHVPLEPGPARLEAWQECGQGTVGVRHVAVRRR